MFIFFKKLKELLWTADKVDEIDKRDEGGIFPEVVILFLDLTVDLKSRFSKDLNSIQTCAWSFGFFIFHFLDEQMYQKCPFSKYFQNNLYLKSKKRNKKINNQTILHRTEIELIPP